MKKILLPIVFLLLTVSLSQGQISEAGILNRQDYNTIQIINNQYSQSMSLDAIANQPVNGSWSQLNPLGVGLPTCSTSEYTGTDCYVRESGIEIYYADGDGSGSFSMGRLTITNANFGFRIKGQLLKVGDDVSKVSFVHSDAYNKRHKVPSKTNENQVLLYLEGTDVSISFNYDTQTNCIIKIEFFLSLV